MDFSHYTGVAVSLAVDLVDRDLAGPADLQELLAAREVEHGHVSSSDLREALALRERLRAVFVASSEQEAAELINRLAAESEVRPELSDHDGTWHLHFAPRNARLGRRLAANTAMGLAVVLADSGLERFKSCEADGCERVFVDLSRNVSRRYCGDRCANRENVAAYRARAKLRGKGA